MEEEDAQNLSGSGKFPSHLRSAIRNGNGNEEHASSPQSSPQQSRQKDSLVQFNDTDRDITSALSSATQPSHQQRKSPLPESKKLGDQPVKKASFRSAAEESITNEDDINSNSLGGERSVEEEEISPESPDDSDTKSSGTHSDEKTHKLQQMLELIPGKTKEELLDEDLTSAEEAKPMGNMMDELEAVASENERAKNFYNELLDNPYVGTVVVNTQSQQIVWVNQFSCFLFNLVESDLIGQDVSILLPPMPQMKDVKRWHRAKVADYMHRWKENHAQPESKIVSGRVLDVSASRYEGINKVGFNVQVVCRPVQMSMADEQSPPFALVGYFRDVSAEKNLKTALSTYKFITVNASEAMVVIDYIGTIKEANSACEDMFGWAKKFLVTTEANISSFTPPAIRAVHDRYLKAFRDKVNAPGFDILTSPIVGKSRDVMARRSDGVEFPVQLRVELIPDGTNSNYNRLVGYIRDCRALIKASEFKLEVSKRLFPESIAKIVAQKEETEIKLVQSYKNIPVILLDMVGFTGRTQNMDHEAVFDLVNTLYKKAAELAVGYQVEVVKATGDGVIAVCGIDEFDDPKSRMDRAVAFALSLLHWTQTASRPIRVGIGYGELGSAVFEISKGRPTWDVWANAVCEASRMEHCAHPQSLQLMMGAFKVIREPGLKAFFELREHTDGIKGLQEGLKVTTYETNIKDFAVAEEECQKVLNVALSRVFLKRENARELEEQQLKRKLTGA